MTDVTQRQFGDEDDLIPNWARKNIKAAKGDRSLLLRLRNVGEYYLLAEIPNVVFEMEWLESLHLSGNQLTAVPPEIGKLKNLTGLYLDGNQLAAVSPEIGQLQNLTTLNLSGNLLTDIPAWLFSLPKLEELYLHNNPIQTPPPEILELNRLSIGSGRPVDLNKVRAYFGQLAEEGDDTLYEAKLIILGEAGAGKTTLVKKLQDPTYLVNSAEPSTEGIDVAEWGFPLSVSGEQTSVTGSKSPVSSLQSPPPFRVNIWDFGGQEIYHATHKFFLTRRSLYALVADAREQKTDFYYWLNVVELLSDNSPALIISNEKQNRAWPFNENQLRGEFNSLKDVFPVNLADEDNSRLNKIIEAIKYHIVQLPHVGQTLPKTWVRVRAALEEDLRNTMPLPEYLDLCQQHGFRRHDDKLQLSDYLHDLGVCLHYQDDPLLNKTLILKPEWGTAAVYAVLESDDVKANRGRFSRANLAIIWHEEKYAPWRDELLQLMIRFQLCYQLPGDGDYIAPQLLSENKPHYPWDEADNLQLRFRYPTFMPKGILTRFIVATHRLIANQDWVWKTGVILQDADARAEIIEHYQRREITVRVQGGQKRDLLTKIGYEFEKIHSDFPDRLQIKQLIPCNCSQCKGSGKPYFFDFGRLKKRLAAGKTTTECEESYETVDVWRLIDDVGARQQVKPDPHGRMEMADLSLLRRLLLDSFNPGELKDLCFELGIDYDDLPGDGRSVKARELILRLQREGRLDELVAYGRKHRPHAQWQ
ncbi:MAG: leucine-rich repeat domain-containing protein [Anaerolineales bacterium]|nr:leucine-rich repeat domain-containing protein [Anaerolineales bacterium]